MRFAGKEASMTTRREFIKTAAVIAGGAVLPGACTTGRMSPATSVAAVKSRVVSAAADDMLIETRYNPAAVGRAFAAGMKELTGEKTEAAAWASMFSPDDVVGIKINCLGAPRVSSSVESINAVAAGLKSAGVKDNAIIVWDRLDREFQRTGLTLNKGPVGMRVTGTSTQGESILPWVEGYDRDVFLSLEDGTLKKFRQLIRGDFLQTASYRQIFNSVTWLWMLSRMGDPRAVAFEPELRRLYTAYDDREGIRKIAEAVADKFEGVTIPDEEKSCFSRIVTRDITKLVNIAVLKHNEDSGVTWATKNIALGVTTNKVRFHIDFCARAIPAILSMPCLKDKMVLHIGEAAKISTVSVAGTHLATDNRIFFSRDPVALDRIGLDILEDKRKAQGLESIRPIATHVASCAAAGLGTDDLSRIDRRELRV
jgi:hypothetical protein